MKVWLFSEPIVSLFCRFGIFEYVRGRRDCPTFGQIFGRWVSAPPPQSRTRRKGPTRPLLRDIISGSVPPFNLTLKISKAPDPPVLKAALSLIRERVISFHVVRLSVKGASSPPHHLSEFFCVSVEKRKTLATTFMRANLPSNSAVEVTHVFGWCKIFSTIMPSLAAQKRRQKFQYSCSQCFQNVICFFNFQKC